MTSEVRLMREEMKELKAMLARALPTAGDGPSPLKSGPKQLQLSLQIANGKMQVRSLSPVSVSRNASSALQTPPPQQAIVAGPVEGSLRSDMNSAAGGGGLPTGAPIVVGAAKPATPGSPLVL